MQNIIRELRHERGLSQEDLARAAGVSRQTIISIEKGRYAPSLALAFTLAAIFESSIESMFTPGD
ncbi:MAG: helix-turn-helix transcriptional regulator [Cellulomonas sp.]